MTEHNSQSGVSGSVAGHGLSSRRAAWRWIPSLYFAEGIPYVVVMIVSVIMYKRLGVSNTRIALYTSWLYLPWVIKPVWSPLIDVLKSKRWWIVAMQLLIGAGLAGVALTIPTSGFLQYTLAFLNCAVAIEQFGYGFGFTAYMLYMLYISQGEHETAHFAICTGFMALGVMLPGMWSGWLQELIGYEHFFIWILIATIPSFLAASFIKIDPEFGMKRVEGESGESP